MGRLSREAVGEFGGAGRVFAVGEAGRRDTELAEGVGEVLVAGEQEELMAIPREVDQHLRGKLGAVLVEVDEDVVEDHREMNPLTGEILHDGETEREEELFPRACGEQFHGDGAAVARVDELCDLTG